MAKIGHKTSKREKKFNAKGGVKGRLDKGETIATKGKSRRNNSKKGATAAHDIEAKNKRRKQAEEEKYVSEKQSLRDDEDFMGKNNLHMSGAVDQLGGMDVGSFFAHLEDELVVDDSDGDSDSEDGMGSDDDEEEEVTKAPKKKKKMTKKQLKEAAAAKKAKASKKTTATSDSESDEEDNQDAIEKMEANMKKQMAKLESDDPEFHDFLQENEQELLEYDGDDVDMAEDDDNMDDNDNDDESPSSPKGKKSKRIELTPKILNNLEKGAFDAHGLGSLKKIVRAYKSACMVASSTGETDQELEDAAKNKSETTYHIEASEVFDELMVTCLGKCHDAFYFHLLASDKERDAISGDSNGDDDKKSTKDKKKGATKNKKKPTKGKKSKDDDSSSSDDDDDDDDDEEMEEEEVIERDSEDTPLDPKVLEKSPRWNEVKSILHTFFKATLHLISESKEPDLLSIVLKAMSNYMRFMTPFPRIAESFLKTLTELWSAPLGDASADYQVVRLNAFLRIRQLALTQPFPFLESCLKKTYLAYTRRAKFGGNSASIMTNALPTLTFMGNCLVELYSLDHHSSYQHAFVYIRQLALHLRTAMQKKTPESFQQVYCWQYMHCLKLWTAVLSSACKQEGSSDGGGNVINDGDQQMRTLVYPLTEIILGIVRMAPAPSRHVPLRFHCIRLLQQLAASSELYIPTTSLLLETLDFKELNTKSKKIKTKGGGDTTRGIQLPFLLKLAKDDPLRTAEEHEAVMAEIFKLLNREVDLYRFSAGFPEFSMQIIQRLKKFNKTHKNSRWRAYARGSVDLCKRHADFAINARSTLKEAPRDVKRLECLRLPKIPTMSQRYNVTVEKENKEWTTLIAAASVLESKTKRKMDQDDDKDDVTQLDEENEDDREEIEKRRRKKKQKKAMEAAPPAPKVDRKVMGMEDDVEEGVDWSDEEESKNVLDRVYGYD